MIRKISFPVALGLASVAALAGQKCTLSGAWRNELGSQLQIGDVCGNGSFSGQYCTAVSLANRAPKPALLVGSQHLDGGGQPTFGFTVNWKSFSDSTTVFTGQCFEDEAGKEILQTMWLLREKVKSPDNWSATRVGTNVFTRIEGPKVGNP